MTNSDLLVKKMVKLVNYYRSRCHRWPNTINITKLDAENLPGGNVDNVDYIVPVMKKRGPYRSMEYPDLPWYYCVVLRWNFIKSGCTSVCRRALK